MSETFFVVKRLIVGDGSVLENAVLYVQNGRISGVSRATDVSIPENANVIQGETLLPGLIDAHVHHCRQGEHGHLSCRAAGFRHE